MELRTQKPVTVDKTASRGTGAASRELKIRDVMSKEVVTIAPSATVFDTAKRMAEAGISCVVVVDGEKVVGILSERDLLRTVAGPLVDLRRITVAQTMSSPVQSVSPMLPILTASRILEARQIRRLPVLEGRQLVGIVTQTDITRGLVTLIPLKCISDIMTREVATVAIEASVADAASIMAAKRISCVVVMRQNEPAGILTEKDMIRRVVTAQRNPTQTRVTEVMSSPITIVPPDYSVLGVCKKMDALHLHRLVVMDAGKVCGIVTQTDIMRAIRAELERIESERWGWMTELATQIRFTIENLQKLEDVLLRLNGVPRADRKSADTTPQPEEVQVQIPKSIPCPA
jgi:CBS domain-containing protein